jgi:hypothetical protein
MADRDHKQLADKLEHESETLERHGRELEDEIKDAKSDWERKRADPGIPGANPPEEGGDEEPSEQQTPPG